MSSLLRGPLTQAEIIAAERNGHSLYGASGWTQKLLCAGSMYAQLGRPDDSGADAAEGTIYHAYAEAKLGYDDTSQFAVGKKFMVRGFEIVITHANLEYADQYVEWCRELPGQHFVERLVDLSPYTPIPKQKGTADHAACRIGHVTISDLKFGEGVQVFAFENDQAIGYALGFIDEWDFIYSFETVTIRICQPRMAHFDEWHTTVDELREHGRRIKAGLELTLDPAAKRIPSTKACRFCRAKRDCPAAVALIEHITDETFEFEGADPDEMEDALDRLRIRRRIVNPNVVQMSTQQIAQWLRFRKVYELIFREMYNELQFRVMRGEEADNWIMKEGRASRKVLPQFEKSISRLAEMYGIDRSFLIKSEFKSPAELEKVFVAEAGLRKSAAKTLLDPFIRKVQGASSLALNEPGVNPEIDLAGESFDDESDEF